MAKVYSTFQLARAEHLVNKLGKNNIKAYVVDYSQRTPGSRIGLSIHEIPTVFIVDDSQYQRAMNIVSKFDPKFIKAIRDSDIGKVSITKVLVVVGVIFVISLFGGLLWT